MRRLAALLLVVTLSACASPLPTAAPASTNLPAPSVTPSTSAPPVASPSPAPTQTPSPSASASVVCVPERATVAPALAGDLCPPAVAAVRAAVAGLGTIARIYIGAGMFMCGNPWPGVGSPMVCAGPLIVPGMAMAGWVSFEGTASVAAVSLRRDMDASTGAAVRPPAWTATVVAFGIPPAGWVMP